MPGDNDKPKKGRLAFAATLAGSVALAFTVLTLVPSSFRDFMPLVLSMGIRVLAIPVVLAAVILGHLAIRRRQMRLGLLGCVLGYLSVSLFIQEWVLPLRAVDRTSGLLWRLVHPPAYEMVLQLRPDARYPLSAGDLAKTAATISSRLHDLGRFYVPHSVPPDSIVIPLTARDERIFRRLRPEMIGGYVTFHLVHPDSDRIVAEASQPGFRCPEGYEILRRTGGIREETYVVKSEPELRDSIRSAELLLSPGEPLSVGVNFDDRGSKAIEGITSRHRGGRLAILLDGTIIAAPVVEQPIREGRASIGCGDSRDAMDLTQILRSGGVPCPIRSVETRKVSQR